MTITFNKRQRIPQGQSKIENTTGAIKNREYHRGNQKWTIQRNWQQDEDKRLNKSQDFGCVMTITFNKRQRIPQGQSKMDNPEKLATRRRQTTKQKSRFWLYYDNNI